MNRSDILVSVIIPTHGRPDTLNRAIKSVLNQTYANIELIVVDDNNPGTAEREETERLMQEYMNDNKVKYVKNTVNMERSYSRNHGAKASNGAYLAFMDDDDEYYPRKIESQLDCILSQNDPKVAMCYSNYIRVDGDRVVCRNRERRTGNLQLAALARNFFCHPGCNLLMRRDVFFEIAGFDEQMSINEDIDLLIRAFRNYEICYCPEPGLIVHVHRGNGPDAVTVAESFLEKERSIIESYPVEEQKKILRSIGLQLYRSYLRNPQMRKQIAREYDIGFGLLIRYATYLGHRFVTKTAYGFSV